jgi:hypothetical protein
MTEFLMYILKKEGKNNLLIFSFISIIIMLTAISILDVYTNNDTTISSSAILNEENVQYELRKNETKFREQIFQNLKTLYSDKSFDLIDSISKNHKESSLIKNYIVLNKLKNGKKKYQFNIPVKKATTPILELTGIKTTFEIDFEKLNNIINASELNLNEDNIKYGNYLKTEYIYEKKIRYDYLIIGLFIFIAILIFNFYKNRIGLKNKDELIGAVENLQSDKKAIKQAQNILKDETISKKEIIFLMKLVKQIEKNLDTYKFDNILQSVLYVDTIKAEKRSLELYNRSTLMLILGLLIAVVGILIFYFTLPEFNHTEKATEYIALVIRPTFILLFVQSISIFLLRQYRSLINDYKYFHNDYLKKSKTFVTYQLMQNENISEIEMKLIDNLLTNETTFKDSNDETPNFPEEKFMDIIKILVEKVK